MYNNNDNKNNNNSSFYSNHIELHFKQMFQSIDLNNFLVLDDFFQPYICESDYIELYKVFGALEIKKVLWSIHSLILLSLDGMNAGFF